MARLATFRLLDLEGHTRAIWNVFELLEDRPERGVLELNCANRDILDNVITAENRNLNERVAFPRLQCLSSGDEPIHQRDHQPIVRIVPLVQKITELVS